MDISGPRSRAYTQYDAPPAGLVPRYPSERDAHASGRISR
jgi:hypothetical protein